MQENNLIEAFTKFEREFDFEWKTYITLSRQLDQYRGIELGESAETVNAIIKEMQESFVRLYPCLSFVVSYSKISEAAIEDYLAFVEALKTAGAIEYKINNITEGQA